MSSEVNENADDSKKRSKSNSFSLEHDIKNEFQLEKAESESSAEKEILEAPVVKRNSFQLQDDDDYAINEMD